jgi:hypothetical protein
MMEDGDEMGHQSHQSYFMSSSVITLDNSLLLFLYVK